MITAASDLSENVSKVKAIFGEGAESVIADSNKMARAFGTSKNEYLDAAGKFGGLFKGAGFSGKATADLSQQFVRLAGDASSFFNTDFETAFMKLRSGLAGEAEPLRDFGVFLTEDATKAYAYAHGIAKVGQELTNQQKIQARSAQIMAALSDARGDQARTAGGVANLARNAMGSLENLGATIGTALLPVVTKVLTGATSVIGAIAHWAETSTILSSIGSIIDSTIVTPIEFAIGLVKMINAGFAALGIDVVGAFTGIVEVIAAASAHLASFLKMLTFGAVDTAAVSLAATPKFKQVAQAAKLTGAAAGGPKAHDEIRFAGATEFGSREAYSSILKSRGQFAKSDTQRQLAAHSKVTADNSARQVVLLQAIQKALIGDGHLVPTMRGASI
jgi:hypothetical protein